MHRKNQIMMRRRRWKQFLMRKGVIIGMGLFTRLIRMEDMVIYFFNVIIGVLIILRGGNLIKGGYSVEVSGYDGKKVVWEVAEYHFINETNNNSDI